MIIYFEKVAPSPNQGLLTAKHATMSSQVGPVLGHCVMFMWWNKMLRNDRLSVTTTPPTQVGWSTSRSIDALELFSNNYTYVCTWRLRLTYQKSMATDDEHGFYGDVSLFWNFTSILICLIKGFPRPIKDFPRMKHEFCLDSSIIKRTLLMAVAKNLRMGPFCLNDLPSGERVLGSKQTQDPPTP